MTGVDRNAAGVVPDGIAPIAHTLALCILSYFLFPTLYSLFPHCIETLQYGIERSAEGSILPPHGLVLSPEHLNMALLHNVAGVQGFDRLESDRNNAHRVNRFAAVKTILHQCGQNLPDLLSEKALLPPFPPLYAVGSVRIPIIGDAAQIEQGRKGIGNRRDMLFQTSVGEIEAVIGSQITAHTQTKAQTIGGDPQSARR